MLQHGFATISVYIVQEKYGSVLALAAAGNAEAGSPLVEALVASPLPRQPGAPLVDDWGCLRVR